MLRLQQLCSVPCREAALVQGRPGGQSNEGIEEEGGQNHPRGFSPLPVNESSQGRHGLTLQCHEVEVRRSATGIFVYREGRTLRTSRRAANCKAEAAEGKLVGRLVLTLTGTLGQAVAPWR